MCVSVCAPVCVGDMLALEKEYTSTLESPEQRHYFKAANAVDALVLEFEIAVASLVVSKIDPERRIVCANRRVLVACSVGQGAPPGIVELDVSRQ